MLRIAARSRWGLPRRVRTFGEGLATLFLAASCSLDDRLVTFRSGDSGPRALEECSLVGETLGPWTCVQSHTLQNLRGVWGAGPNDAWAVGSQGAIVHFDGSAWSAVASGATQDLSAVWGSGSGDVWAVGAGGTILHWNGSKWSAATVHGLSADSTAEHFNGVWGSGSRDVYAVGDGNWVAQWNGSSWDAWQPVTYQKTRNLYGAWGSSLGDVWLVGQFCSNLQSDPSCGVGTILHFNGANWTAPASNPTPFLHGIWGSGPNDVWAVGDHNDTGGVLILRLVGSTWADVSPADPQSGGAAAVWGSSPNDVWVVGFGLFVVNAMGDFHATGDILHFNGSGWTTVVKNSAIQFNGVWGSGPNDVWAVANGGTILHKN